MKKPAGEGGQGALKLVMVDQVSGMAPSSVCQCNEKAPPKRGLSTASVVTERGLRSPAQGGQALNLDLSAGATGDILNIGTCCGIRKSQSEASPDTILHALKCRIVQHADIINPLALIPA